MNTIEALPRTLNLGNIDQTIVWYKELLNEIPLEISSDSLLGLMRKLKRDKVGCGPYPHVSIFESSNRIMTDLVILYGVRSLLQGAVPQLSFSEYAVEYGAENKNDHDVSATEGGLVLRGEAFNVANSFFQVKKNKSLQKLRDKSADGDYRLILYNSDAVDEGYRPKTQEREIHWAVAIDL